MASIFGLGNTQTRPLVIHSSASRISIPISTSQLSDFIASETLAQEFHDSEVGKDESVAPAGDDIDDERKAALAQEAQVKLLARFLTFNSDKITSSPTSDLGPILLASYERFNDLFLKSANIHSLVQSFEPDTRAEILAAYFKAFTVSRAVLGESKVNVAHSSALLEAAKKGEAELYALFGGQGVNEVSSSNVC
jgi:fatty acid synthase subunit beta, fungi type